MGQVVDQLEAGTLRMTVDALDEFEVDVVDRAAFAETVDQVDRRTADALDRRQAQLHRPGGAVYRLGAQLQGAGVGLVGVLHPEGHAAGRRAVLGGEVGGEALRLLVEDQVDVALAVQVHVLGAVGGDLGEAHHGEDGFQGVRRRGGEFDELEAHQAHRVFKQIGHLGVSLESCCLEV
ncbi:hypothetical protein D3C75_842810 [compost metagenome]